jgi:hypothetical protein
MLTIDRTYIMYGLSIEMQKCVKNAMYELKSHTLQDVLDVVATAPSFSQREINIMLFEIGRLYERGLCQC